MLPSIRQNIVLMKMLELSASRFQSSVEVNVRLPIPSLTAQPSRDFVVVDKDGNPNTSGLLKVSANPAETDSIRVQLSYNPLRTKGKKFIISLASSATEGVVISGTKQCEVTILDLEDAVSKFFGKWGDADETIGFTIEEYDIDSDPDEIADYYPNCSFAITAGGYWKCGNGGTCIWLL